MVIFGSVKSLHQYVNNYKKQIGKGDIIEAYRGIMRYMMSLRNHLKSKYPNYNVSGLYQGYMDMTYFAFTPESLINKKLKICIVFQHGKVGFEIWLAGMNKQIQSKYWKIFKEKGWNKYRMPSLGRGVDAIIEYNAVDNPDFDNLSALTVQLEKEVLKFTNEIKNFLTP